jgi:hypothetical protein
MVVALAAKFNLNEFWRGSPVPQALIANSTLSTIETTSEPRQPRRFENISKWERLGGLGLGHTTRVLMRAELRAARVTQVDVDGGIARDRGDQYDNRRVTVGARRRGVLLTHSLDEA